MTTEGKPASKLLDWRTAYFALVAVISMLIMAIGLIGFLQGVILSHIPQAWGGYGDGPRYQEIVENGILALVMGALFCLHGLRFFRKNPKK